MTLKQRNALVKRILEIQDGYGAGPVSFQVACEDGMHTRGIVEVHYVPFIIREEVLEAAARISSRSEPVTIRQEEHKIVFL